MRVSVHPNRHKYLAGVIACVSVTQKDKHGQRTTYAGTVWLSNVVLRVQPAGVRRAQASGQRNVHAWAVGEQIRRHRWQIPPHHAHNLTKVTYHFDSGEFRILDTGENVTGMTFPYAHIVGRDFYILDNRPGK